MTAPMTARKTHTALAPIVRAPFGSSKRDVLHAWTDAGGAFDGIRPLGNDDVDEGNIEVDDTRLVRWHDDDQFAYILDSKAVEELVQAAKAVVDATPVDASNFAVVSALDAALKHLLRKE